MADDEHGLEISANPMKGILIRQHPNATLTVATSGPLLGNVVKACCELPVNVIYFPTIKPLDIDLLSQFSGTKIVVIHDAFGLFEAITNAIPVQAVYYGIPDRFCCHYGTLNDIRRMLHLDISGIHSHVSWLL